MADSPENCRAKSEIRCLLVEQADRGSHLRCAEVKKFEYNFPAISESTSASVKGSLSVVFQDPLIVAEAGDPAKAIVRKRDRLSPSRL